MKLKRWLSRFRLGLLGKIVLVLIAVGLVPLAVAAWQLIGLNKRAFQDQVLRLHAIAVRATTERIDAYINARQNLSEALANNPSLYTDPAAPVAANLLTDLIASTNELEVLTAVLVDTQGNTVLRAQRRDMADTAERVLSNLNSAVVQLVDTAERRWLVLRSDLPQNSGQLITVFQSDELSEMLVPVELGDEASLLLGDQKMGILAGSQGMASLPETLLERAHSTRVSGSGRFKLADGSTILGAHATLHSVPWFVVTWQPVAVAEKIATSMRRQSFVAMTVALSLVALLAVAAYLGLVKPIRQLITGQMRLAGMGSGWQGGDEITQLKTSFAMLEKHLANRGDLESVYLGRYRVDEKVGEGAMGTVYRGWDPKLKRPVALKTIRLDRVGQGDQPLDLVAQLLNEAVTAGKVHHTNVVGVYDIAEADGFAFVAMEFIDGASLDHMLGEVDTLPIEAVVFVAQNIAEGLQAAHHEGILHRDIKPGNIMINRHGVLKVADFGISKLVTNLQTEKNTVFGTPGYLPPEVLSGGEYRPSGDLFAVGVLMYRCLTGQMPFHGATSREIIMDTMLNDPPPPSRLNPLIPPNLDALVMDLIAKSPRDRVTDASQLLERLAALQIEPEWSLNPDFEGAPDVETIPDAMHAELFETIDIDRLGGHGRRSK